MITIYHQICDLRTLSDPQERGYKFEQLLREALPWSLKPPIVVRTPSEQIDAFFEWNSWHFLVEAKAKDGIITEGSHDFEDFENKVRRRNGGVIGLFCSLNDVGDGVFRAAQALNRENKATIILAGSVWDELCQVNASLEDVLRFSVFHARSTFAPCPPHLSEVARWMVERNVSSRRLRDVVARLSARFLRRNKSKDHAQLYVGRHIEQYVWSMMRQLKPASLQRLTKSTQKGGQQFEALREAASQILILRDSSGSGKTMFSVQACMASNECLVVACAAQDADIDDWFSEFHSGVGVNSVELLLAHDTPILFVIDSLDETEASPQKRREISAILRRLEELNDSARHQGLIAFPAALLLTVRDEYWGKWESLFEGRKVISIKKQFSSFTEEEFREALTKYSVAFGYSLLDEPQGATLEELSVPFNLATFSEAHAYEGTVTTDAISDAGVVGLYFRKKREDIYKRRVPGLTEESFLALCSALAIRAMRGGSLWVSEMVFVEAIQTAAPLLTGNKNEVMMALISDGIFIRDVEVTAKFRFRHSRILEYLVAYYILNEARDGKALSFIDVIVDQIRSSGIASSHHVHSYLLQICRTEFPTLLNAIEVFFQNSNTFVGGELIRMRRQLAYGEACEASDIEMLLKRAHRGNSRVVWESFFVLSAKHNEVSSDNILETFIEAWNQASEHGERWKLIEKLKKRGLLLEEVVVKAVLRSKDPKEWETYLGGLIELDLERDFRRCIGASAWNRLLERMKMEESSDWDQVHYLLKCMVGDAYTPGLRTSP